MAKEIIMYSKSYCPFCKMAQELLTAKGLAFRLIDAEQEKEKFSQLVIQHSHSTVPMIFIDGECIGGFDSLSALEQSGNL